MNDAQLLQRFRRTKLGKRLRLVWSDISAGFDGPSHDSGLCLAQDIAQTVFMLHASLSTMFQLYIRTGLHLGTFFSFDTGRKEVQMVVSYGGNHYRTSAPRARLLLSRPFAGGMLQIIAIG